MLSPSDTRISSRVTPRDVAPPLSPDQNGTQGGDCGSSIWRGGSPTHLRTRGTMMGAFAAGTGVGVAAEPAPAPPLRPLLDDWSVGASVMFSTDCGANSAMVG